MLVPTRELAIQVAEAFQKYAAHLRGFHVLPIYGGQSYTPQLNALKRGAHVIVGTPGRVMDHLERGTLELEGMRFVVLDEADEMLHMGFVDDIESILSRRRRSETQVALFSATMPLADPAHLRSGTCASRARSRSRAKTTTATNIRQRYWLVSGMHKLDALTRILEVESFDAHAGVRAHQAIHRRTRRAAAGARLRRRGAQRRPAAGAARAHRSRS